MARIEEQDKKKNQRIITIIAFCILGVAIIIDLVILLIWLNNKAKEMPNDTPKEPEVVEEVIEDKSNEYNRLLELVNLEANNLSYTPATKVISIDFQDNNFYITASNDNKVYNYSINTSSIGPVIEDALEYLLESDPDSSMTKVFDSYNLTNIPSEFTSKYLSSSDIKNNSIAFTSGDKTYITSTLYSVTTKKVNLIYKVDVNTVLDNSYSLIEINSNNESIYSLYRYIATR